MDIISQLSTWIFDPFIQICIIMVFLVISGSGLMVCIYRLDKNSKALHLMIEKAWINTTDYIKE